MAQNIVRRAEFARLAGVSSATVTALCRGTLKHALIGQMIDADHPAAVAYLKKRAVTMTEEGLDPLHEDALKACQAAGRFSIKHIRDTLRVPDARARKILADLRAAGHAPSQFAGGRAPRGGAVVKANKQREAAAAAARETVFEVPEDIAAFADLTLRELVEKFGTDIRFLDWLKATKAIEDINEKRLKNAQTVGELVNRRLVKVGVIEPIDAAHIKLLTDGAKTIARRATAMHSAGRTVDDIERFIVDQMASFIRPVKARITRALKDA